MKNNLNYFNNEERNGIFLLITIILLFSIFIFLQKRILPSETSIAINVHESNFQSELNFQGKTTSKIATHPISKVYTKNVSKKIHQKVKLDSIPKTIEQEKTPKNKRTSFKKSTFKKSKWKPKVIKAFSLNSQDPEEWKQIKGIGDGFSSRIIKYQNWLGGFHSPNQLNEVYGLEDSLVQVIIPYLENRNDFRKMKINYAEAKELGKHPYIEWKEANIIVKYRKHHFPITKDSFMNLVGVSEETKIKVMPYIDFSLKNENITNTDENENEADIKISGDNSINKGIDSTNIIETAKERTH
jgi:DNA uptake protein ComE-like DNA-binding protein